MGFFRFGALSPNEGAVFSKDFAISRQTREDCARGLGGEWAVAARRCGAEESFFPAIFPFSRVRPRARQAQPRSDEIAHRPAQGHVFPQISSCFAPPFCVSCSPSERRWRSPPGQVASPARLGATVPGTARSRRSNFAASQRAGQTTNRAAARKPVRFSGRISSFVGRHFVFRVVGPFGCQDSKRRTGVARGLPDRAPRLQPGMKPGIILAPQRCGVSARTRLGRQSYSPL